MMKRNLHLNFCFSKEEALADPAIENWMKGMTAGSISPKPKWDSDFPDSEAQLTINNITIDKLCAVYLLDDNEPQDLANALLISFLGKEIETLSKLFVIADTQEYDSDQSASEIGNWNNLSNYVTQCSDILITDRYILSRDVLLQRNLFRIVNALVQHTRGIKINIVIAVEKNQIGLNINVADVIDKIKENVEEIVGQEPYVTIMECSQPNGEPLFHDRLILTNYRAIESGDSFNYFRNDGKINTGGNGLSIKSVAKNFNYIHSRVINTFVKKMSKEIPYAIKYGDKKSNFLIF